MGDKPRVGRSVHSLPCEVKIPSIVRVVYVHQNLQVSGPPNQVLASRVEKGFWAASSVGAGFPLSRARMAGDLSILPRPRLNVAGEVPVPKLPVTRRKTGVDNRHSGKFILRRLLQVPPATSS